MSPRPRTVSDEAIFAATVKMMGRLGPARLTLASVAGEVGLSAATLVQRFGSKRGLLLGLARLDIDPAAHPMAHPHRKGDTPLHALRRYLLGFAGMASTPEELANHLAFFQLDLTDPEFLEITRRITREQDRQVRELVSAAIDAGKLRGVDPAQLSRVLLSLCSGSLMRWAVERRGTARNWLARDIDAAIDPYRSRPGDVDD